MNIRRLFYKLNKQFRFQAIKHAWMNLKRERAKAIFAISGITISLILLTAIGMVNDTMSYNYMGIITSSTGSADIMITRTVKSDLTYDPFFDENLIDSELNDIEGVEGLFPRVLMLTKVTSESTNSTMQVYGIDFEKEFNNGHMGNLNIVDVNGSETGNIFTEKPGNGECVVLWSAAEILNVSTDDSIRLEYQQNEKDLKIVAVCEQDLKFTELENTLVILNIDEAQSFLQREDQVNMIMGTVENPKSIYDVSDVKLTERKLREIGTRIQLRLDPNEYSVSMTKLEQLSSQEFMLIIMTVLFWFIIIISMLITGILINSILSTSTEERIREYGILRVVGGKKTFPVKMVIFEGALMGVIGSIIGIIVGYFFTPPIVNALFVMTNFRFQNVDYVIQPTTILLAFGIGTGTSLFVSLFPAIRTGKLDIIKSITPFHKKEEGWEVKKEESMNVRNFLIGISVATIGMIVFLLLPRIFTSGDFMLIAGLFIGLLAAILLGLVFASVGIIPVIQSIFLAIISPFIRKYSNILKISLKRNRRRNTSTIVMFAISFSFIFFITSVTEMQSNNMSLNLRFEYGTDLVLINQGLYAEENSVTLDMVSDINDMPAIDKSSITLYNMFDITTVFSAIFDFTESGGFDENAITTAVTNIFEFYSAQAETKYQVRAADLARFDEFDVGFIGIDENYPEIMDPDLIIWNSPGSGNEYSFNELFANNNTCIIAKSLANVIGISDVGEYVRLTFFNPKIQNDNGNITLFKVVGISGGMPGFWNFGSSETSASGSGVIVSLDNYIRLMDVEDPNGPNMMIDKVFIDLLDESEEGIEETKKEIQSEYENKEFIIDDAISKINFLSEMYERQSTLMEIINWFAIAIAIFGLISTMYAVILERKFEIGILRSMGMKTKNVRNLFILESLIIKLSSATTGTLIGTYCAYLLETNMGSLTELPIVFNVPFDTLIRVFIISIVVGILGMYIVLIRLSRQSVMEVFRQTF